MNDALRHLEEKIAFLEHHVTEQDKVMLQFSEELDRLKREMKLLSGRLASRSTETMGDAEPTDERPPHY